MSNVEYILSDLLDAHINSECYDKKDVLNMLEDLADYAKNNSRTIGREIKDYIQEQRLDMGICPDCGEQLDLRHEIINRTEAYGSPCNEYADIRYCPNCGWKEED